VSPDFHSLYCPSGGAITAKVRVEAPGASGLSSTSVWLPAYK